MGALTEAHGPPKCPPQPHSTATCSHGLHDAGHRESLGSVQAQVWEADQPTVERDTSPQPFFPQSSSMPAKGSWANAAISQPAETEHEMRNSRANWQEEIADSLEQSWRQAASTLPS